MLFIGNHDMRGVVKKNFREPAEEGERKRDTRPMERKAGC
jgi:hypothetical protein